MKGEIFSAAKWNVFRKTSQEAMEKMLRTNLKDSPTKLLNHVSFQLVLQYIVESIVLPIMGLTVE